MDKYLENFNFMKRIQEDIENLNGLLSIKDTESVIENVSTRNITVTRGFKSEFSQTLTENLPGKKKEKHFPMHLMKLT